MRTELVKLYPCLLVMATAFLTGCPGPYQWRHEHALQGDAMAVAAVTGRSVTLTDGRSFGLAGVSLEGMSPSQIENFENALRGLVAHPWPLPTKRDLNEQPSFPTKARLVPFPTSDGSAVMLIITDVYFHDLHLRRGIVLGFPFTPLVEDDYPIAFDLGGRLLQQGLAYTAPQELPPNTSLAKSLPDDIYPQPETLAEHYASIVADARRLNLGIHHTDERALKLAALADDRDAVEALLEKNSTSTPWVMVRQP